MSQMHLGSQRTASKCCMHISHVWRWLSNRTSASLSFPCHFLFCGILPLLWRVTPSDWNTLANLGPSVPLGGISLAILKPRGQFGSDPPREGVWPWDLGKLTVTGFSNNFSGRLSFQVIT